MEKPSAKWILGARPGYVLDTKVGIEVAPRYESLVNDLSLAVQKAITACERQA